LTTIVATSVVDSVVSRCFHVTRRSWLCWWSLYFLREKQGVSVSGTRRVSSVTLLSVQSLCSTT
jgi:hypothetical protein